MPDTPILPEPLWYLEKVSRRTGGYSTSSGLAFICTSHAEPVSYEAASYRIHTSLANRCLDAVVTLTK